jgi:hypothetical protein
MYHNPKSVNFVIPQSKDPTAAATNILYCAFFPLAFPAGAKPTP